MAQIGGAQADPQFLKELKAYDPTLTALRNAVNGIWLICQDRRLVPNVREEEVWQPPHDSLVGVPDAIFDSHFGFTPYYVAVILSVQNKPITASISFVKQLLERDLVYAGDRKQRQLRKERLDKHNEAVAKDNRDFAEDITMYEYNRHPICGIDRKMIDFGRTPPKTRKTCSKATSDALESTWASLA